MSKPKEYWIFKGEYTGDYAGGDFYSTVLDRLPDWCPERLTHVIDKSAYNKAVEALSNVDSIIAMRLQQHSDIHDDHECWDMYGEVRRFCEKTLKELGEL